MKLLKTYPSSYYILLLLFLLFFSHTIFYIKYLNILLTSLLVLFISITFFYKEIPFPKIGYKFKIGNLKLNNIFVVMVIILPSIIYLNKVSFGDFNWGGDHRDHVLSSLVNNEFWLSTIQSQRDTIENFKLKNIFLNFFKVRIFLLIITIGLTFFLYKKNYGNLANIILLIIFYFWSTVDFLTIEKDPRGLFFISLPINSLFFLFELNLMEAIRFTNFFSIIFWLLILRPMIIGEFPNFKVLPFALAVYWNPQMIFIVNGGHVDPWSIIFLLLALEIVIRKGLNFSPQAIILLGIGACFKSYVAFLIPCFFLYGKPWIKNNERRLIHFFTFFSSILPVYFFTKLREGNYWQPIKLENYGFEQLDNNYFYLANLQLENYRYILIIFLICFFIFLMNFVKNKWESAFIFLTSIFYFSILFFNNQAQMMQHVMYFRYYMIAFIIFFIFILKKSINLRKKYLVLMVVLIPLIYSFELTKIIKINKNSLYKLNFSSFINSDPLFLGLDPLIKRNKNFLDKKNINEVYISRSTQIIYRIPTYLYTDIKVSTTPRLEPICECTKEKSAIINFYPKVRGPLLKYRRGPPLYPEGWGQLFGNNLQASKNECIKKMNNTCSILSLLEEDDKTVIAALGIE